MIKPKLDPDQVHMEQRPAYETDLAEHAVGDEWVPEDARHWRREHFIPLSKAELSRLLTGNLQPQERAQFEEFYRLVDAIIHSQYGHRLEHLKQAYAPFDADDEMRELKDVSAAERQALLPVVFDRFDQLLERANYHSLSRADLKQAIGAASDWGIRLHVDFEVFDRLEVYGRGDIIGQKVRRRWQNLYKPETVDVPIYQRLVLIFHLKPHKRLDATFDVDPIHIQIFKNIPKQDMDMLLPGSRVRMSLLDRTKILVPTVSGIALNLFKLVRILLVLAVLSLSKVLVVAGLVVATVGYLVRSAFGYFNTQAKYRLNLTQSLYYQNLDNNLGAIFRLVDDAEEQEIREVLLAYYVLWQQDQAGCDKQALDDAAERLLKEAIDVDVDFEVDDALDKLQQLKLAARHEHDIWKATPITAAIDNLKACLIKTLGLSQGDGLNRA